MRLVVRAETEAAAPAAKKKAAVGPPRGSNVSAEQHTAAVGPVALCQTDQINIGA